MRNNRVNILVRLVWSTAERLPLIAEEIEDRLYRYIRGICDQKGCPVVALGGTGDHVHLVVSLAATVTVADLVANVKGSSSHFVNKELGLGGGFRWQSNYGAFSVSPSDRAAVIAYVCGQRAHHESGHLWPHAERDGAEPNPMPASAGPTARSARQPAGSGRR